MAQDWYEPRLREAGESRIFWSIHNFYFKAENLCDAKGGGDGDTVFGGKQTCIGYPTYISDRYIGSDGDGNLTPLTPYYELLRDGTNEHRHRREKLLELFESLPSQGYMVGALSIT